uniref:RAB32a, member RAS oncogene family n=2 Tax=Percomorphaceae TaxID=1489872 RepID=A0A096MF62_POEFO
SGSYDLSGGFCVLSMAGGSVSECKEYLFKVLVIGELGVGKTSIIKRYVHQLFSQHYRATIGVDFALKVINWDSKTLVRLQLWDIAGKAARLGPLANLLHSSSLRMMFTGQINQRGTFDLSNRELHWLDLKSKNANGSQAPWVLLSNKLDLKRSTSRGSTLTHYFCYIFGLKRWCISSFQDNINVDEAARFLVENILANDKGLPYEESNGDRIKLDQETVAAESKSGCC